MAYIPEDRTHVGTAPDLSITDNVIMKQYRQAPIAHGGLLDMVAATRFATQLKDAYEIIARASRRRCACFPVAICNA